MQEFKQEAGALATGKFALSQTVKEI